MGSFPSGATPGLLFRAGSLFVPPSNASGPDASHSQGLKAPEHNAPAKPRAVRQQSYRRKSVEQHLENDPAFQARQWGTKAVVDSDPEREMRTVAAPDIEPVRIHERCRIVAPQGSWTVV